MTAKTFDSPVGFSTPEFLEDLSKESLKVLSPCTLIAVWIWAAAIILTEAPDIPAYAVLTVCGGTIVISLELCERHLRLAVGVYLSGVIIAITIIILAFRSTIGLYLYAEAIFVAAALMSPRFVWSIVSICVMLVWVTCIASPLIGLSCAIYATVFILLTAAVSWVSTRRLLTALAWTLSMSEIAAKNARDAQARRGELYRILRALEEATYRIERMNNQLVIAWHEAEDARTAKARFAATVSHEMRGSLNLLLGFSKVLALSPEAYGQPLPDVYRSDIYTVYRAAEHLAGLVDDVLDLSQIEVRRFALVKGQVDLEQDVIAVVMGLVRPLIERKSLYLRKECESNLPSVPGDAARLRQVLLNLLTNAIRFTERGGITIRLVRQGDKLECSVHDTGSGIAEGDIVGLFREFAALRAGGDGDTKSSGLGLSICKHIVQLHGGEIWAHSKKGVGTAIHFTIPLASAEAQTASMARSDGMPRRASLPTCLVVHADPDVVRVLGRYLEGYHVIGLPENQDICGLVEETRPRGIVTGPELAEQVKSQLSRTSYNVPIISCGLPHALEHLHSMGVIAYLVKPVAPQALTGVMRNIERDGEVKVLLVDDEPEAVRLLELQLTSLPHPYKILRAYSGADALKQMQSEVPDIAFIDMLLPDISGAQVIEQMRANRRTHDIPVVIVSARDWTQDGLKMGMPIIAHRSGPLGMTKGVVCIKALLDALSPDYVPAAASPSLVEPLGSPASGALRLGQTPKPDALE